GTSRVVPSAGPPDAGPRIGSGRADQKAPSIPKSATETVGGMMISLVRWGAAPSRRGPSSIATSVLQFGQMTSRPIGPAPSPRLGVPPHGPTHSGRPGPSSPVDL